LKQSTITIKNETGLHARPAALLVTEATKFKSLVTVNKGGKKANLKSLLGVLSLGICQNDEIIISADGEDESEALDRIITLLADIDNKFMI
jgi:phosphocarrier protein HPr